MKTPHFEEYLRVKVSCFFVQICRVVGRLGCMQLLIQVLQLQEVILLDLLKVISHHGARLATPIRSVQRVLDENESRQSPFRDVTARSENHRPFLLVEAAAVHDSDKEFVKVKAESGEASADRSVPAKAHAKAASVVNQVSEDVADPVTKAELEEKPTSAAETKGVEHKENVETGSEFKSSSVDVDVSVKPQVAGVGSSGLNPDGVIVGEDSPSRISASSSDSGSQADVESGGSSSGKLSGEKAVASVVAVSTDKGRARSSSEKAVPNVDQPTVSVGSKAGKSQKEAVSDGNAHAAPVRSSESGVDVPVATGDASHEPRRRASDSSVVLPVFVDHVVSAEVKVHTASRVDGAAGVVSDSGDDPWREPSQAALLGVASEAAESVIQEHGLPHVRPTGGLTDDRLVTLPIAQTWEENVLLGVAIDTTAARALRLEDELPLPSEPKAQPAPSPNARPQKVEDVLILGVALDGSQRTLHLGGEEKASAEQRELVTPRNGNGSP